jgi:hypothetical protein
VVAEVLLDNRWIIVDPTFHLILRDSSGHLLTREELARPDVYLDATRNIERYDLQYNYEHTAFIHLARIPLIGSFLQSKLNSVLPAWQEDINWTVLVERQSYSTAIVGVALLFLALFLRRLLLRYAKTSGIHPIPLGGWDTLKNGGVALFSPASTGRTQGDFWTL